MPQCAPTDHRVSQSRRRDNRSHEKRRLVAHPSGGMLVHRHAPQRGVVQHHAGIPHRERQRFQFFKSQPSQPRRHQPRRKLFFRNRLPRRALDQPANLFCGQPLAVTLFANQINGVHKRL